MNGQLTNRGRVGRKGNALLMVNINRIHVVVKESIFLRTPPPVSYTSNTCDICHKVRSGIEVRHQKGSSRFGVR